MSFDLTVLEAFVGLVFGALMYWARGVVDDWRARRRRREERYEKARHGDLQEQRELLMEFLGEPKAHFLWLTSVSPERLDRGEPSADKKVQIIAEWVYKNAPRFPKPIRLQLYSVLAGTYPLLHPESPLYRPIRERVDFGKGVAKAWADLEEYKDQLTRELTGAG